MKRIHLFLSLTLGLLLALASCKKYDDSFLRSEVDDVQKRLENLVQSVNQNESDIQTLQTLIQALQDRNYIVAVEPWHELIDGTSQIIGYNIRFQNDTEILIKHGNSQFKDFEYDLDYVYMTLADGTRIDIERAPVGAIKHAFSVSATKRVFFSKGNLQYNCQTGLWRFAEHQYDVIGLNNTNSVDNPKYFQWISLFAWGTSGWHDPNDDGNTHYMPHEHTVAATGVTNNPTGYGPSFVNASTDLSLVGTYANYDWGVHNPISNGGNQRGLWRTPTKAEWDYVIKSRPDAKKKLGAAAVNEVNGIILLPDEFELPDTLTFASWEEIGVKLSFTDNTYTAGQWKAMERQGALFLPVEGRVYNTNLDGFGTDGFYQTATAPLGSAYKDRSTSLILLTDYGGGTRSDFYTNSGDRKYCCSVRLIQDVVEE
ncbi:MAG: hypothetical protein J6Z12_02315 [Paludibacteraceae bacterium]|nr:hypothetical protein [Paludibacteraceae bacterium]